MAGPTEKRERERPRRRCACCLVFALVIVGLTVAMWIALNAFGRSMVGAEIAKLKAAGKPVTGLDLAPSPVPDDQNAAPLYVEAAEISRAAQESQADPDDPYYPNPHRDWDDPALRPKLLRYVSKAEPALELLREASPRPHARFDRDWSDPMDMGFERNTAMREVARFLSAAAAVSAHQGDRAEALERVRMGAVATRHLSEDRSMLIGVMVGTAVDAIALARAEDVMKQGPPPEAEARELAEELLSVDFHQWYRDAYEVERVYGLAFFEMMATDPLDCVDLEEPLLGIEALIPSWRYADELRYLVRMSIVERRATPPLRAKTQQPGTPPLPKVPGWAGMTEVLGDELPSVGERAEVNESKRRLLVVALGVEVHKQKLGDYPEKLADLEAIDWPTCEDNLTGKPFHYQRKGDSYLLYGVGGNLKDDGGTPPQRRYDLQSNDMVWGVDYSAGQPHGPGAMPPP